MNRWSSRVWLVFALAWMCACSSGGSGATGGVDSGPPVHDGGALDGSPDGTVASLAPPTFAGVTSATAIDESHIALAWSPATDATTPQGMICYRVYAGTTAGGEDFTAPVLTTPAGATGALVRGLVGDTTYYFVVRAVDADGNEEKNTVEQSAMTPDTSSPTFAGVQSVTATGINSLLVTWNPATDTGCPSSLITYSIYYATTSGGESYATANAVTTAGATDFTLTNLAPGQTYYVVVRAVDAAGNSDANTYERSAHTLDTTPPAFAGLASATAAGTAVLLTWSAATDAIDPPQYLVYDVYVATTPGGEDFTSPSYAIGAGGTSFTAENLAVGTTYYFVVRARDTSGNEDTNTVEKSATTGAVVVTTPPTFGGAVSATGATDTTIVLTWNAATAVATPQADIAYDVYEAAASGAEEYGSGPTFTAPLGATTFTVTGLQPLQTWYFVVRARDLDGNEDTNTHEVSAKTPSDVSPPSFGGLTSAEAINPVEVALAWQPASDSATPQSSMSYEVFVGATQGGEGTTPIGPGTAPIAFSPPLVAGTTTATVTGLTPGTQYWFYVRAVDAAGLMDTTPTPVELKATTPADIPTFAGASTSASTSPTSITVGWVAATDPDPTKTPSIRYLVYVSTTPGAELSATPIVSPAGTTSATITGLTPSQTGTKYYVVVRAQNSIGATDTNDVEILQPTQDDTTAPTFAGATSTNGATPSSLTVNWSAASDPVTPSTAMRYLVCMTMNPGGCSGANFTSTAANTVTGGVSFTATGLSQNTTYYFVVRAEDEVGLTDGNSAQVSGITVQTTFPPPTFTTVPTVTTPATSAKYTTLPMSWLATAMPSGTTITYTVCYSTSSTACGTGGGTSVPLASPYTETSVTISGLPPATTATNYYVSVTATATGGSTTATSKVATVADVSGPLAPTGFTATTTAAYPNSVDLSWTAATGDPIYSAPDIKYVLCANSCAITYTFNSAFTSTSTSSFLGAQGSTTQGASLTTNTGYTFTIQAIDPLGNASPVSAAISGTTAVSFAKDVLANIFNGGPNECNGCHGGGDIGPTPGPYTYAFITTSLTPTPTPPDADIWGTYTECAAGQHFVVAGNLDASILYQKMARPNACSPGDLQMPYGGPYDAGLASVVGAWILQGAVNN